MEASGLMWSVGLAQVRHALLARVVVSGRSLSKGTHIHLPPRAFHQSRHFRQLV